ncbi:conjugal transfer protein [Enterococcus mundtii]|nr:conjugal transfer protein [Enterococcus mundtii]
MFTCLFKRCIRSKKCRKIETRTQEMVLPIQAKDQLFAIVSRPYFLTSRLPQGKTDQLEKTKETIELSGNEKEEVETFLEMFLKSMLPLISRN